MDFSSLLDGSSLVDGSFLVDSLWWIDFSSGPSLVDSLVESVGAVLAHDETASKQRVSVRISPIFGQIQQTASLTT